MTLTGELTFASAAGVLASARPQVRDGSGPVEIDLSAVTRVDSAGLALLLELAREAREHQRELRCTHAPEQLRRLAEFFGIMPLLAFG